MRRAARRRGMPSRHAAGYTRAQCVGVASLHRITVGTRTYVGSDQTWPPFHQFVTSWTLVMTTKDRPWWSDDSLLTWCYRQAGTLASLTTRADPRRAPGTPACCTGDDDALCSGGCARGGAAGRRERARRHCWRRPGLDEQYAARAAAGAHRRTLALWQRRAELGACARDARPACLVRSCVLRHSARLPRAATKYTPIQAQEGDRLGAPPLAEQQ